MFCLACQLGRAKRHVIDFVRFLSGLNNTCAENEDVTKPRRVFSTQNGIKTISRESEVIIGQTLFDFEHDSEEYSCFTALALAQLCSPEHRLVLPALKDIVDYLQLLKVFFRP